MMINKLLQVELTSSIAASFQDLLQNFNLTAMRDGEHGYAYHLKCALF